MDRTVVFLLLMLFRLYLRLETGDLRDLPATAASLAMSNLETNPLPSMRSTFLVGFLLEVSVSYGHRSESSDPSIAGVSHPWQTVGL